MKPVTFHHFAILLAPAVLGAVGACAPSPKKETPSPVPVKAVEKSGIFSSSWSDQDKALKLELTTTAAAIEDLQHTVLTLRVTNISNDSIVIDRKLRSGFGLAIKTDLSQEFTSSEDRDVSREEISRLPRPPVAEARKRFEPLLPGQSVSRKYDLSTSNIIAIQGHRTDREKAHHGFYYEANVEFRVPPAAKKLFIEARYDRGVWMMAEGQFERWFGMSSEAVGLCRGMTKSNAIAVERKQP